MPTEKSIFDPNPAISRNAYISSFEEYKKFYAESLDNPAEFWSRVAKQFHWETPADPAKFLQYNFNISKGPISIKWMEGASTNICYNLLDRNVRNGLGDQIAYYWWVKNPIQMIIAVIIYSRQLRRSYENKSQTHTHTKTNTLARITTYWFFPYVAVTKRVRDVAACHHPAALPVLPFHGQLTVRRHSQNRCSLLT